MSLDIDKKYGNDFGLIKRQLSVLIDSIKRSKNIALSIKSGCVLDIACSAFSIGLL